MRLIRSVTILSMLFPAAAFGHGEASILLRRQREALTFPIPTSI